MATLFWLRNYTTHLKWEEHRSQIHVQSESNIFFSNYFSQIEQCSFFYLNVPFDVFYTRTRNFDSIRQSLFCWNHCYYAFVKNYCGLAQLLEYQKKKNTNFTNSVVRIAYVMCTVSYMRWAELCQTTRNRFEVIVQIESFQFNSIRFDWIQSL